MGFVAFFMIWAGIMRWKVPALHIIICHWLENTTDATVRVLLIFRGAAKSTIYAVYKAWRLYCDPTRRSLVWSADRKLAKKMNRDVIAILRRHPACRGMLPHKPGIEEFWVSGSIDERNASMSAFGVLSDATGGRADDVDFDDIEVPKNIKLQESREKLRERISDSTHILVPGGQKTYIGTPHTHDSIYDEQINGGAAVLKIPLFEKHVRYDGKETTDGTRFRIPFEPAADGYYVFVGIHKFAKLLIEGRDYEIRGGELLLKKPCGNVLDIYAECSWSERFNRRDLAARRKETRTLNAWDSQYGLQAKPLHMIRLDPDKLVPYNVEPVVRFANNSIRMMLGKTQIVSAAARWDCALGRLAGDVSAFSVLLQNAVGHYFWHKAKALTGDVYEQCRQIKDIVVALQLPRVVVETNGPGAFAPAILRKTLAGTGCAVVEDFSTENKTKRILDAFEAPLSGGFLWAHVDVIETVEAEMRDWKPELKEQQDDYLDSAAGAIREQPMRIGKVIGQVIELPQNAVVGGWRPNGGVHEVQFEAGD